MGRSSCYRTCAKIWPPALASRTPLAGQGVAKAKLSATRRKDHARQIVYNGHPLYGMDADARPGEMEGEGFLGTWFVVSPAGHKVADRGAPSPGAYSAVAQKTGQRSGTPLSFWGPRGLKVSIEPVARSRTVPVVTTSPAPASAQTRAAMCTAMPTRS